MTDAYLMKKTFSSRQTFLAGLRWTVVYRLVSVGINFVMMMVLVRVLGPEAYGQAGVVSGFLAVLNVFCVAGFMRQALQLPDGMEPDWSLHFTAGFHIQLTASIVGHLAAGVCWFFESLRPVAPLLHIGAVGILLDWPSQLGAWMYMREMNYKRMRMVDIIAVLAKQMVTLMLALGGAGAYAIVIGSNVATLPFMLDLFLLRRWRPSSRWWRWPNWSAYRPALKFGLQNIGSGLLQSGPGALASAILPGALGYTAIGFWGRAQGLYSISLGQCQTVLSEVSYPLLPRFAPDPERFARVATNFTRVMLLVMVPGALFLAQEGVAISRLVYGEKWAGADSLLWPGVLAGLGAGVFNLGSMMFLALNRLRVCLTLSVVWAVFVFAALGVPLWGGDMVTYAWATALLQLLAGFAVLIYAGQLLEQGWPRKVIWPPVIASATATAVVMGGHIWLAQLAPAGRLVASAALFGAVSLTALRVAFPESLMDLLALIPGGERINRWLGLRGAGLRL